MKSLRFLFILLFPLMVSGQPEGKLFIHTDFISNSQLGYIQYPQNQYNVIDTTDLDDMIIINDKLLITNDKVYFYDINTLSKTDSVNTNSAYMLSYDNNKLIVSKNEAPYFEVYDLISKTLIFSLDTNKVKFKPIDILADMGKAYLLYDTTVLIIDLNLQDTIANITAIYSAWFPSYNLNLINKGNKIYINVGIATGAPRFAILSLDKTTLQIENVLFQEFIEAPYEPVLVNDKIYMSSFPSYYDIIADTFIYNPDNLWTYPLCFDEASNTIFLYKPSGFKVNYYNNNTFSAEVTIPSYINKAVYYNEGGVNIAENNSGTADVKIYPNPTGNDLNIMLPSENMIKGIRITALNGNSYICIVNSIVSQKKIDISHLSDGIYLIEIQFENQTYKSKFIKSSTSR